VVFCQLLQIPTTPEIGTAIANVSHPQKQLGNADPSDQGSRSHSPVSVFPRGSFPDGLMRGEQSGAQQGLSVFGWGRGQDLIDSINRYAAGYFSRLMPSHAVGQQKQSTLYVNAVAVLVQGMRTAFFADYAHRKVEGGL